MRPDLGSVVVDTDDFGTRESHGCSMVGYPFHRIPAVNCGSLSELGSIQAGTLSCVEMGGETGIPPPSPQSTPFVWCLVYLLSFVVCCVLPAVRFACCVCVLVLLCVVLCGLRRV